MADKKPDVIAEFEEQMVEEAKFNDLKKEVSRNKTLIDHVRTTAEIERQKEDEADLEILKTANFGMQSPEQIAEIQKQNMEYMLAAKSKYQFILAEPIVGFDKAVPFFRKNLIFIGAKTGDGKSTAVANIAFSMLRQKSEITGKSAKILIISNEERREDVYNRITCLLKGWSYTNHNKFTDAQIKEFNDAIPILSTRVTVIDNVHEGAHDVTVSIEGIQGIFDNLIQNGIHYDCIIIDYYQNVITSKKNSKLNDFEVQARLARLLDRYKNMYPAPIILMGQVNAPDENGNPSFGWRIQGRKLILTVATLAMEMVVNKKQKLTNWVIWKSRFAEDIGEVIQTGFQDGKFVPYTQEFATKIQSDLDKRANDKLHKDMDKANALPNVFNGEEDE